MLIGFQNMLASKKNPTSKASTLQPLSLVLTRHQHDFQICTFVLLCRDNALFPLTSEEYRAVRILGNVTSASRWRKCLVLQLQLFWFCTFRSLKFPTLAFFLGVSFSAVFSLDWSDRKAKGEKKKLRAKALIQ